MAWHLFLWNFLVDVAPSVKFVACRFVFVIFFEFFCSSSVQHSVVLAAFNILTHSLFKRSKTNGVIFSFPCHISRHRSVSFTFLYFIKVVLCAGGTGGSFYCGHKYTPRHTHARATHPHMHSGTYQT